MSEFSDDQATLATAVEAFANEYPIPSRRAELKRRAARFRDNMSDTETDESLVVRLKRYTGWSSSRRFPNPPTVARLRRWMDQTSREQLVRSRQWRVLLYPIIVVIATLAILIALSPLVLQPFAEMFDEFGLSLPTPTALIIWISNQLEFHLARSLLVIAGAILAALSIMFMILDRAWGTRWLGLFVAGNVSNIVAMAAFVDSLSESLEDGNSVSDSLKFAGEHCGHRYFREAATWMADHAQHPATMLIDCPEARVFPGNILLALRPEPNSAPNIPFLREIAELYAERVIARTDWGAGWSGVLAIFLVGFLVGFVVIALFMPLVELVSGLS